MLRHKKWVVPLERLRGVGSMIPENLLLYDGVCVLSNRMTNAIFERNWYADDEDLKGKVITFTPRQSVEAKRLLQNFPKHDPNNRALHDPDSIVLIQKVVSTRGNDTKVNMKLDEVQFGGTAHASDTRGMPLPTPWGTQIHLGNAFMFGAMDRVEGKRTGASDRARAARSLLTGAVKYDLVLTTNSVACSIIGKDLQDRLPWKVVSSWFYYGVPQRIGDWLLSWWFMRNRYAVYGKKDDKLFLEPDVEQRCPYPTTDFKVRVWKLHDQGHKSSTATQIKYKDPDTDWIILGQQK